MLLDELNSIATFIAAKAFKDAFCWVDTKRWCLFGMKGATGFKAVSCFFEFDKTGDNPQNVSIDLFYSSMCIHKLSFSGKEELPLFSPSKTILSIKGG